MLSATYRQHGHSERPLGAPVQDDHLLDFLNVCVESYTPNPSQYSLRKQVCISASSGNTGDEEQRKARCDI
jgi:hypothetical protein